MDEMAPSFYTEQEKEVIGKRFPTCEKISIDYAVMEKSKDIFTLPAKFVKHPYPGGRKDKTELKYK